MRAFVRSARARRRRRVLLAAGVLAIAVLGSLTGSPEPARADPVGIGGMVGLGVNAITGGLGGVATEGFGSILKALFSWPADLINRQLLAWLVSVPDYAVPADTTGGGAGTSNLSELARTTSVMAFAALAAVGTVAGLRFWAAGLSGSGGYDALEGLGRIVAVALLIVLWPWLFKHVTGLVNAGGRGLLVSESVLDDTSGLLGAVFASSVTLNFFAIVIACAAGLLFLGLLLCKVAVSATTALLFVSMPIALLTWVLPETAWIAKAAMRAFGTVLCVPFAWALCFATFAAMSMDSLAVKGSGSLGDALVKPLVALALLWITVKLPGTLARMAMIGGAGSGMAARTASYMSARRADAALSGALGGQTTSGGSGAGVAAVGAAATVATGGAAAPAAAAAAAGPGAAATGAGSASAATGASASTASAPTTSGAPRAAAAGASRSASPAPTAQPSSGGHGSSSARQPDQGAWREVGERINEESAAAKAAEAHTTTQAVTLAMRALSPRLARHRGRGDGRHRRPHARRDGRTGRPRGHQRRRTRRVPRAGGRVTGRARRGHRRVPHRARTGRRSDGRPAGAGPVDPPGPRDR